ncbi:MAG: MFS transporter [Solirubrobacterales bacterium]|nr:MFS transporter [Solirubrobacterales bacterium]
MKLVSSDNRRWLGLATVCLAQLMNVLDTMIVNVALPSIQHQLHFSQGELTWVINAFLISFGSLLLFAGRLGDLAGRKRVFLGGLAVFTVASLVCGLADSSGLLIGARFVQGVGAALQASVILAIIVTEFPEPEARAKAMSAFVFTAVAGGTLGLLLGGVLTQALNWHWIFFVNLPIGILAATAGQILIPNDRGLGFKEGIDWFGSVLVTGALASIVYGIVQASSDGWGSGTVLGALGLGLVLAAAFFGWEARVPNPIFPLRVLRVRGLISSSVVRGFIVTAMYGLFFNGSLYLEKVAGFGALDTGLAFLPWTLMVAALSLGLNRRLVSRFGVLQVMIGGILVALGGMALMRIAGPHAGYFPLVFIAFLAMGFGIGNSFTPLMTIAMADVPHRDAGLASGIVNVSQQVGGALGLAILGTVATSHTSSLLRGGTHGADALVGGYHMAYVFGGVSLAIAIALALVLLRAPGSSKPVQTNQDTRVPEGSDGPGGGPLEKGVENVEIAA